MKTPDEVKAAFRDEHFHVFKELGVYHWVAGGALVSVFLNEPARDIDYFFPDQNSANLALDLMLKRGFRIIATEKDHHVVEKSGRVIDIFHRGEAPQETIALFDYEHVCAAIDSELNLYQHDNFNQRLADKKLVVQNAEDFNPIQDWPLAIPRRALKFLKKGYTIDHEDLIVVLEKCVSLGGLGGLWHGKGPPPRIPYRNKKFIDLEHMKISACGPLPRPDRPYKNYQDYVNTISRHISKDLKICNTDTVLDIGPGLGDIPIQLSKIANKIHCCDINSEFLESAAKNCEKYKNIFLHPVSDIDLPLEFLPNNSVDKAYEQLVFIHNDAEIIFNYLKELKRVLKPNGLFRFRFCIEKLNKNIDIIECDENRIKEILQKLNYKIIRYKEDDEHQSNRGVHVLISNSPNE